MSVIDKCREDTMKMLSHLKPRDPKRIDRILQKLGELWKMYPDQRLGQLIENDVIPSGRMRGALTVWLHFAEDDIAERNLDKMLRKNRK